MNNAVQSKEKTKNYSKAQEDIISANSPMNLEGAKTLAAMPEFKGKSWQSIVAKIGNMGLEYISKVTVKKKTTSLTKPQIVAEIGKHCEIDLTGLEKSTVKSLMALLVAVRGMEVIKLSHHSAD